MSEGSKFIFKCVSKPDVKYFLCPTFKVFQSSNDVFPSVPRSVCGIGEACRSLHCIFSPLLAFSFQGKSGSALPPPRDYIMGNICRSTPFLQQKDLQVSGETRAGVWGYFWCFGDFPEHLHLTTSPLGKWSLNGQCFWALVWGLMSSREPQDGLDWKGAVGSSAPASFPHAGCAPARSPTLPCPLPSPLWQLPKVFDTARWNVVERDSQRDLYQLPQIIWLIFDPTTCQVGVIKQLRHFWMERMLREHVKSSAEVKLSYICCCSPDPRGSLRCHRRKLGWLDVICSLEIGAGCYLSPCHFLGAKRQIAWLFTPRFFWALKSGWFVPNSPDSPFLFLSFRRMMYLLGDNSFTFLPDL